MSQFNARLKAIETEITAIKERNHRVEGDKAWETSYFRIGSIAAITHIVVAVFLYNIGVSNFLVGAFVPVFGFILSSQSLPFIKRWWIKNRYGR